MDLCKASPQANGIKVAIDDAICTLLSNERQALALDFVSFLRSLRMSPQWASRNSWSVSYKGKRVCYIKIIEKDTEGAWYIRPSLQYDQALNDFCAAEGLVPLMLKNVHFCKACGKCAPGKTVTYFGEQLDHVCCAPIDFEFHNPGSDELECAKKLILYSRKRIDDHRGEAIKK